MQRPSSYTQRRGPLEVKMTPMIDVVFLLLVFFVWSASFQIVELDLPSRLSKEMGAAQRPIDQPPPPEADFDDVVVRILWDGRNPQWQVNGAPYQNLDRLADKLVELGSINSEAPVIIHPDPLVPLGDVMDVWDKSRLANFQKVQFAALEGS